MASYQELNRLERNRFGSPIDPRTSSSIANLFSGGQRQANFLQGAKEGATLSDVLAQARRRQLANVGLEALADQADKAGNHDIANLFRAANSAEDAAKARDTYQGTTQRGTMFDQAKDPNNLELLNREVLSQAKEPVALSAVEGNSIVNRFLTPDHQSFDPTAVGQADIKEKRAQAKSALAAAFEHTQQGERAKAGIGADKAGNYEIVDTPEGKVRINKLTNESTPVTMDGKPVMGKVAEKFGEKLPEGVLKAALSPDGGTQPDPQQLNRYLQVKQQMGSGASDADVIARLRQQDADAATDGGPPADLAGQGGIITRMFGGNPGNQTGQPYPDANAVGAPAAPAQPSGKPTLQQFLAVAKAHNPSKSDQDLADYYNKTYGGQ